MKRLNNAFTLTELLIALGVIAILCAILLPMIFNILPNKNVVMAKRAFYATKTAVSELINDETCYPDKTLDATDKRYGFDDGRGYANCQSWGGTTDTAAYIENEGEASKKFFTLFASKLGANASESSGSGTSSDLIMATNDNMIWTFKQGDKFGKTSNTGIGDIDKSVTIMVDVNGEEKPNTDTGNGDNLDQFTMKVYTDGRVTVETQWAKKAVNINQDITETVTNSTTE